MGIQLDVNDWENSKASMALTGSLEFFSILELIPSGPVADDSFILLIMFIIPWAVNIIGGICSLMTRSEEMGVLMLASFVKTEENATLSTAAVSLSLSSTFLSLYNLIGVAVYGFIAFQNCFGLVCSILGNVVSKKFRLAIRIVFVSFFTEPWYACHASGLLLALAFLNSRFFLRISLLIEPENHGADCLLFLPFEHIYQLILEFSLKTSSSCDLQSGHGNLLQKKRWSFVAQPWFFRNFPCRKVLFVLLLVFMSEMLSEKTLG